MSTPNTSATGGYLLPTNTPLPGGLTLKQFIQTVIVGVSGYPAMLVRPNWQIEEPLQPAVTTDWIGFGITSQVPDDNAYTDLDNFGVYNLNRQKSLEMLISFYGPNAEDNISAFTDGFQIQQNLEALRSANMGFKDCSPALHVPEVVNGLWMDRYDVTLTLVIQVLRSYSVLSFASATVTVNTVLAGGQDYSKTITVEDS